MDPLAVTMINNTMKRSTLRSCFEDDRIIVMQSDHKDRPIASNNKKFDESRKKKKASQSPPCSNNLSNCDEN